jgi:CTP synthase (UTP-ammonia lyase)
MKQKHDIRIALVGDYDEGVPAHQAIPVALDRVAGETGIVVEFHWLPTPEVGDGAGLQAFDGIWCVPASPYRDMNGALTAIRYARENQVPFLGTCGGFQHALLEYARNYLGWSDAEHAETAPDSARAIITPLSCSLGGFADSRGVWRVAHPRALSLPLRAEKGARSRGLRRAAEGQWIR